MAAVPDVRVGHTDAPLGSVIASVTLADGVLDQVEIGIYNDAVLLADGNLAAISAGAIDVLRPDGTLEAAAWSVVPIGGTHPAVSADGGLLLADILDDVEAIWRVSPSGDAEMTDTLTGLVPAGLDVPRAGPLEDGLLVVLAERAFGATFELWRWRRAPGGALEPDGTFRLDLRPTISRATCWSHPSYFFWRRISVRPDGESFVVVEPCHSANTVVEYDLEGRRLGVVAEIPPDPTIPLVLAFDDMDGDGVHENFLLDVLAMPDGSTWALTERRLYHVAPDGTLTKIDHLFGNTHHLTAGSWVPFASETSSCDASGIGYWKRQCLGEGAPPSLPAGRGRLGSPVPGPPLHPHFGDGRLPDLLAAVDLELERHDVTTCEALWPAEPRELRSRVLTRLAALLLDVRDKRLGRRCVVPHEEAPLDVRSALARIHELLDENTDESLSEAHRLAVHAAQAAPEGE
jgi:hypothetical protein